MAEHLRVFHGQGSLEGIHYHHFSLHGRGAFTRMHGHVRAHFSEADKPVGVYVIGPDGHEIVQTIGFFDARIIVARRTHLFFALEDGITNMRCIFPEYDMGGKILDPKQQSSEPYEELIDEALLPQLVKEYLASH